MHKAAHQIACIVLLAALQGCSDAKSPLLDGLTLKYELSGDSVCEIQFKKAGENFKVHMVHDCPGLRPSGTQGDFLISPLFKTPEGEQVLWGVPLPLAPTGRAAGLTAGNRIGGHRIAKEGTWKGYEVAILIAKIAILEQTFYFDKKTGFLVGSERGFTGDTKLLLELKDRSQSP